MIRRFQSVFRRERALLIALPLCAACAAAALMLPASFARLACALTLPPGLLLALLPLRRSDGLVCRPLTRRERGRALAAVDESLLFLPEPQAAAALPFEPEAGLKLRANSGLLLLCAAAAATAPLLPEAERAPLLTALAPLGFSPARMRILTAEGGDGAVAVRDGAKIRRYFLADAPDALAARCGMIWDGAARPMTTTDRDRLRGASGRAYAMQAEDDDTPTYLGALTLCDAPKPDAAESVACLRRAGLSVCLSGACPLLDRALAARRLGIDPEGEDASFRVGADAPWAVGNAPDWAERVAEAFRAERARPARRRWALLLSALPALASVILAASPAGALAAGLLLGASLLLEADLLPGRGPRPLPALAALAADALGAGLCGLFLSAVGQSSADALAAWPLLFVSALCVHRAARQARRVSALPAIPAVLLAAALSVGHWLPGAFCALSGLTAGVLSALALHRAEKR